MAAVRFTPCARTSWHNLDTNTHAWADEIAASTVKATRPQIIHLHPDARPYSTLHLTRGILGATAIAAAPGDNWVDLDSGRPVDFSQDLGGPLHADFQKPRTLDLAFRRNETQAQPDAIAVATGKPAGRRTFGILTPANTVTASIQFIGRESRRWREGRALIEAPTAIQYQTRTDAEGFIALFRKNYGWRGAAREVALLTGLPERTIRAVLSGRNPSRTTRHILAQHAIQLALELER